MSMALLAGFIVAYPMNRWLVANHLKHGMMTVRPKKESAGMAMSMGDNSGTAIGGRARMEGMAIHGVYGPWPSVSTMTVLSFLALAAGLVLAFAGLDNLSFQRYSSHLGRVVVGFRHASTLPETIAEGI
jgi:hypothetical protein